MAEGVGAWEYIGVVWELNGGLLGVGWELI